MYRVSWKRAALRQWAALYASSSNSEALAAATQAVEFLLQLNPASLGESRDEGRRLVIEPPLAAWFKVYESTRQVKVLTVRMLPQH